MGQEDPLEKEMASHSSILAWEMHGQRSLAGYSPWSHEKVRHTLTTKQQQYISLVKEFLKIPTYIEVIRFDSLVQSFTNFLKVNFKFINIYILLCYT